MGIYPIESILSNSENKAAYKILSDNFENIVPYVGTGLSFYCKSWGAPFEGVLENLKTSYYIEFADFNEPIVETQKNRWAKLAEKNFPGEKGSSCATMKDILNFIINVINNESENNVRIQKFTKSATKESIFKRFDELIKSGRFLELGELLNAVSVVMTGTTFNERFHDSLVSYNENAVSEIELDRDKIRNLASEKSLSKLPSSIWFLPYIGGNHKFIITTNCDDSIAQVFYSLLTNNPNFYSGLNSVTEIKLDEERHHLIYHIHGIQRGATINTTNSYIMTWSDYRRAYNGREGSPLQVLEHYFTNRHYLFIGASLDQDMTLEKMKATTDRESATARHTAFMNDKTKSDESHDFKDKLITLQEKMATKTIVTPDFDAYSVVLCQLVRERKKAWKIYFEIGALGSKTCEEVDEFMESTETFRVYPRTFLEEELDSRLYPALHKYIYDKYETRCRTYDWAVCRVETDAFFFPIEPESREFNKEIFHLDTYSAPLGNTIYIIGGSQCVDGKVKKLIKRIKRWTEAHTIGDYWTQNVRVRIFMVSCTGKLDPAKLFEEIESIIGLTDENEKAARLGKLLEYLREYKTYSKIFSIDDDFEKSSGLDLILNALLANMYVHAMFKHLRELIDESKNFKSPIEVENTNIETTIEADIEHLNNGPIVNEQVKKRIRKQSQS